MWLVIVVYTGNNDSKFNTGGDNNITTGSSNIDANILNIANMNLMGGTMWLVIVNEAGNWVGKLFGSQDGNNFAGSPLFQFLINPVTGSITATNSENGADSTNVANGSTTVNNTTTQTNTADINNTLNLSANTGNNTTNYNTGGNSNITTGDANIVANLVNFVNNNIVGNGKLVVTVVNVFGSWIGDFITPGSSKEHKENNEVLAQGGTGSNNSSNNNSSTGSTNTTKTTTVAAVGGSNGGVATFTSNGFTPNVDIKVAGANTAKIMGSLTKGINDSGKPTVNLAWAILALPVLAIFIISRKLYIKVKSV
jgi:hypothetical protein